MKNGCGDADSHRQLRVRGKVSFSVVHSEVISPSFRVTHVLRRKQISYVRYGREIPRSAPLCIKMCGHPSRSRPFVGSAWESCQPASAVSFASSQSLVNADKWTALTCSTGAGAAGCTFKLNVDFFLDLPKLASRTVASLEKDVRQNRVSLTAEVDFIKCGL